jgi:hypothetical protein
VVVVAFDLLSTATFESLVEDVDFADVEAAVFESALKSKFPPFRIGGYS